MLYDTDDEEQSLKATKGINQGNLSGMEKPAPQRRSTSFTHSTTSTKKHHRKKESSKETGSNNIVIAASVVDAYKYVDNKYETQGKLGATLLANKTTKMYSIVLYSNSNKTVVDIRITAAFSFNIQENNYASFSDNSRQIWSLMFDDSEEAENFAREVAIAKSNVSVHTKLIQQDLVLGTGEAIDSGDSVEVNFTGWLFTDGTLGERFDGTEADNYVTFKVGKGRVIKGWDQGMLGIKKGGKRLLIIPPSLAYGSQGASEKVPPNSTVIIEFQVIGVKLQKEDSSSEPSSPAAPLPVKMPAFVTFPDQVELHDPRVKGRSKSITEHPSHVPDGNKAKLISRMARMGQPMLPVQGPLSTQSEDSEDELHHHTPPVVTAASLKPHLPAKPRSATVIGIAGHAAHAAVIGNSGHAAHAISPPAAVISHGATMVGSQPMFAAAHPNVHQPQPPAFLQNLPGAQQLAVYQSPAALLQQQQEAASLLQQHHQQQQLMQQHKQFLGHGLTTNVGTVSAFTVVPVPQTLPPLPPLPPPPPPVPQIQQPPTPAEPLAPVLLTESRQQNTEIRLDLSKMAEKIDKILEKVEKYGTPELGTHALRAMASFGGNLPVPSIEANVLMKNVTRIVEENERLKREIQEQSTKVHEQNERISVMLERNQKYVEQSHSILEQRNEGFKATASQSQARVLALEQEKIQVSTELSTASAQISKLQLEVGQYRKHEGELKQQLMTANALTNSVREEVDKLRLQRDEDKLKIENLSAAVRDEKQFRKIVETKLSNYQEELSEMRSTNEALERNFNDKKRKSAEERKKLEEEMEDMKISYEQTVDGLRESLRKLKSSVETETHSKVSKVEEEISREWQRKCDRIMAAAAEKHSQEMNDMRDEKNDMLRKISDLEKKLKAARLSNKDTDKFVSQLKDELAEMKLWKDKDNLRTQAAGTKERLEKRIKEMDREKKAEEERMTEMLDKARRQQQQLQQKIQQLQQENSNMEVQTTTMKEEHERRVEEIEREKKEEQRKRAEAEITIRQLQQKMKQLQQEVEQLATELSLARVASVQDPAVSDAHVTVQVKKIMNSVFQTLRGKIDAHSSYKGSKMLVIILDVIKRTTLKLVNTPVTGRQETVEDIDLGTAMPFVTTTVLTDTAASNAKAVISIIGEENVPVSEGESIVKTATMPADAKPVLSASIPLIVSETVPTIVLTAPSDVLEEIERINTPLELPEEVERVNVPSDIQEVERVNVPLDVPEEIEKVNVPSDIQQVERINVPSDVLEEIERVNVPSYIHKKTEKVNSTYVLVNSSDAPQITEKCASQDVLAAVPDVPELQGMDQENISTFQLDMTVHASNMTGDIRTRESEVTEDIRTHVSEVTEDLKTKVPGTIEDIQIQVPGVTEEIKTPEVTEDIQAEVPEVTEDIQAKVPEVTEDLQAIMQEVTKGIQAEAPEGAEDVKTEVPEITKDHKTQMHEVTEGIHKQEPEVVEDIQAQVSEVTEDIQTEVPRVADDIQTLLPEITEDLTTPLHKVADNLQTKASEVTNYPQTPSETNEQTTHSADILVVHSQVTDDVQAIPSIDISPALSVVTDDIQNAAPIPGFSSPTDVGDVTPTSALTGSSTVVPGADKNQILTPPTASSTYNGTPCAPEIPSQAIVSEAKSDISAEFQMPDSTDVSTLSQTIKEIPVEAATLNETETELDQEVSELPTGTDLAVIRTAAEYKELEVAISSLSPSSESGIIEVDKEKELEVASSSLSPSSESGIIEEDKEKELEVASSSLSPSSESGIIEEKPMQTTLPLHEAIITNKREDPKMEMSHLEPQLDVSIAGDDASNLATIATDADFKISPNEDSFLPLMLESSFKEGINENPEETFLQAAESTPKKSGHDLKDVPPLFDSAEDDGDEYRSLFGSDSTVFETFGSNFKSTATADAETKPLSKIETPGAGKKVVADKMLGLVSEEDDKPCPPPPLFGHDSDEEDLDWLS